MKISRLSIKDYHQFKHLDLDLTYPKGHPKEGKPLDKVCFIGQSGTGKTTLLNFLFENTMSESGIGTSNNFELEDKLSINFLFQGYETKITTTKEIEVRKKDNGKSLDEDGEEYREYKKQLALFLHRHKPLLIFFPSKLRYNSFVNRNISGSKTKKIYDFGENDMEVVWNRILNDIQKHQEKALALTQEVAKLATGENSDSQELQALLEQLRELGSLESNPLKQIAEKCLDPVLKNFQLKVKTELDIRTKEDIGNIKIIDVHGEEIPFNALSTGTKQIIFSALPLYTVAPSEAIILYDEPERSLYPDMQKIIINYYESFTEDSQFFFATHSPIIASNFEPWEIIELKFDGEGYVVQELYYPKNKERHVDNYTIIPQYLTYDSMLSKVFDLKETYSEVRNTKVTELLTMRAQLESMKNKNEANTERFRALFDKYDDLAGKLSWDFKRK
jgi:ABC-type lipoprotein export system ATPase subunit